MSEVGGNDDGVEVGGSETPSGGSETAMGGSETASPTETTDAAETTMGNETAGPPAAAETTGGKGTEGVSVSSTEVSVNPGETAHGMVSILGAPAALEQAQKDVEQHHHNSIVQILETNGKYMSEEDKARVLEGVESIRAVRHDPSSTRTGGYRFFGGKSTIEVAAISPEQMERSTKHETNHFTSKHREIIVPEPDKNGYTVYQTVGTRRSSWFHSVKTGEDFNFTTKGMGMNEGLTTMYTNRQLAELSEEKGMAAERQQIYAHATELCGQLEEIVGEDSLKEAYYGGNMKELEEKVDSLAGEKGFEELRDCLDRAISKDPEERVQAMKDAQAILAKMHDEGGTKA